MKLTLKESLVLAEARDPNLKYTDKQVKNAIDRVTVELEKQRSSAMTKLAERYFKLDLSVKKLSEQREKLNREMKDTVEGLFDAQDIVYTRVVETSSFVLTLAKQSRAEEKVSYDFEKIATELAKLIPDELQEKIDEIMETYKSVTMTNPKSPSFTVKPKVKESLEEGIIDPLVRIAKLVGSLLKKVTSWAVSYDRKLNKLKKLAGVVQESFDTDLVGVLSEATKVGNWCFYNSGSGRREPLLVFSDGKTLIEIGYNRVKDQLYRLKNGTTAFSKIDFSNLMNLAAAAPEKLTKNMVHAFLASIKK